VKNPGLMRWAGDAIARLHGGAQRKTRDVSATGFPLFCYDNVATNLGPHFFFFLATFFLAAFFLAIVITPFRWVSGLKDMLYLLIVS
jgi:hypothetical protein